MRSKQPLFNPSEREESVGFSEVEEISWHEYFVDFRETVWPMLEKQGFTFPEALMFWRQELLLANLIWIRERLDEQ